MLAPTYVLLLLLLINPFAFGVNNMGEAQAVYLLIYVFTTSVLIPGIGIAVMKPLGFVTSFESPDRQERVGPYIVTGVFYLWLYKNLSAGGQAPPLYLVCVLGATIALFVAFIFNIFTKISAHATGMGGLVGMVLLIAWSWPDSVLTLPFGEYSVQVSLVVLLGLVVILAGLVGMARLVLKVHVPRDLWQGYLVGLFSVWVASWVG